MPFYWQTNATPSSVSSHRSQYGGSPAVAARADSQIQARQLETPLSTVDSSEVVGPKAARTLGSVGLGYKAPPVLILHLGSLLYEPSDLNQNLMSQLTGVDTNGPQHERAKLVKGVLR